MPDRTTVIWADPITRLRRMKLLAPMILKACALTGENRERLMALCWRESLCTFGPGYSPKGSVVGWGDSDNAFGPFQIDKRYHSDFIQREMGRYAYAVKEKLPYDAMNQANYACGLLRDTRYWFKHSTVATDADTLERAVYAAYNAGPAAVAHALRTGNLQLPPSVRVDLPTTGKNYSASIFATASLLQKPEYQWIWAD